MPTTLPHTVDADQDLEEVRQAVRHFAETRLRPLATAADETSTFPTEIVPELGQQGFLGLGFPEEYGGSGYSKLAFAIAIEEVYRVSAGLAASAFMTPLAAHDILLSGSEEQKARLIPPMLSGAVMAGVAVTEPDAGSDAGAIRTRAERSGGGGYRITGRKRFITNANLAGVLLVLARTSPGTGNRGLSLFAVERGTPGMTSEPSIAKLGWRCSDTADLVFDGCELDESALIGEVDSGFKVVMRGFNLERIVLATGAVGLGQAALEETVRYVSQREQFGRPIGTFQNIRDAVARMAADVEAARRLAYHAARLLDVGVECAAQASMAKIVAGDMCQRVTATAIQLHGGVGFTMDSPVQRFHRDSMIMTIGGGTSEVQAEVIARSLGLPRDERPEGALR